MKKIMLGLSLVFLAVFARSQGLKNVIVEKYYISNEADAASADEFRRKRTHTPHPHHHHMFLCECVDVVFPYEQTRSPKP